ncbi:MAG: two-component system sensor histidine kinase/response regulator, partial [Deltaproteobacteria bacterium]|nr:two-component system sensor histidine kinase/response regulator [Deltaproteobacteria bacterium]
SDQQLLRGREIDITTELDRDLPSVDGDADLLTNALENVARNAVEAMPRGGELRVITKGVSTSAGAEARIVVTDTGKGMDVRARERALEDFFTTKAEGSGLGLSFVARVVKAHGGVIRLDSEEGRGTTVQLQLPVARPGSEATPAEG